MVDYLDTILKNEFLNNNKINSYICACLMLSLSKVGLFSLENIGEDNINVVVNSIDVKEISNNKGVYGFILVDKNININDIFNNYKCKSYLNIEDINNWNSIASNVYPLYWGKAQNIQKRLKEHLKKNKKIILYI